MFLRTVKARGGGGVQHEYVRLVETVREGDKTKQRVVANLGRKDLLAPHLESLMRILGAGPEAATDGALKSDDVHAQQASCWGPMLGARTLWRELGLESILDGCERAHRRSDRVALSDRALVLVANRLCEPHSEHGLAGWLETDFVCDRLGERMLPVWKQQARVRVDLTWLQRWYRTLDELMAHKTTIEKELFARLRDLFSLKPEMVFYDLTSSYFEGRGPAIAEHGYSRDGKPHNRQVLVGMVMVNGWPIAHHVFRGNLLDHQTVATVLDDLHKRFGLERVVFVGDRGMVTGANVTLLRDRKQGYLVGLQRRQRARVDGFIAKATGPWIECPVGLTAQEKAAPPKTLVQEVAGEEPGVRIFIVHSEERLAYERAMRERSMQHTRVALDKLAARVAKGKLKAADKIGEAAARILARNHGHRYYDWKLQAGAFEFFEHSNFERERAFEGKYVIQTEEPSLTPVAAVQAYKQLSEVERGFRSLKDVIDMRPIFHRKTSRVQAHIFVAALAFLLERALENKLKAASVPMSAPHALEMLKTIHVVDISVGTTTKRGTTAGNSRARQILAALSITNKDPPAGNSKGQCDDKPGIGDQ
ncbi:MAG TPA: IS1634 family transposase [Steroidobacteraceae bacterium]|nr:IS1634 family transposase [Steroidobacteraceae bacterium]